MVSSKSNWYMWVLDRKTKKYIKENIDLGPTQKEALLQAAQFRDQWPASKYHIKLVRTEMVLVS